MVDDKYVLDEEGQPVLCSELMAWARFMESSEKRQLARSKIGDVVVSTVFLGLDHGFGEGPPILWETMIFGGFHDGYQDRYSSADEARVGHNKAVSLVNESSEPAGEDEDG